MFWPFQTYRPAFLSSLWCITALLASSTPAYAQLGLKGKAEQSCLWFVPAGVLSAAWSCGAQATRRFMVNQKRWSNYCFWCKRRRRGREVAWRERYSPCAVIVWLQCCCWRSHANMQEQHERMCVSGWGGLYLQHTVKALLGLSDTISNTNHFKCWDITWLYRGTTSTTSLMIVQPFPSFQINFPHQTAFTCPLSYSAITSQASWQNKSDRIGKGGRWAAKRKECTQARSIQVKACKTLKDWI